MANIELYLPKLIHLETNITHHPNTLSNAELYATAKELVWSIDMQRERGAKILGVSIGVFRSHFGKQLSLADFNELSYSHWKKIIQWHWDKCKADQISNQSIAEILVDWFVVSGVPAIRKAQVFLGISTDGRVGPQMLKILNGPNKKIIFNRLRAARESFYRKAALTNPSKKGNLNEWLKRTGSFIFEENVAG